MGRKLGQKKTVAVEDYNVYVATPAYDGKVDVDYAISMAEAAYCAPLFGVKVSASMMGNGAFIDLARNIFVKKFLEEETDCTHIFFIDSDLKFPANAFIGLIRSGQPICAGVYQRRQKLVNFPVKYAPHPELGGMWIETDSMDIPWIMAERVPTGFLCIRRDIIEEMAAEANQLVIHGQEGTIPELFYTFIDQENRFVGEDFAFSDDYCKKYNAKIPVFANIDFVHGGYECNLSNHLEEKIAEEESTSAA
jgi:hypothetical protein